MARLARSAERPAPIDSRSPLGSLVVVGTGINCVGQMTLEAVACLERAEKVFYVVANPTMEFWIKERNPSATSLSDLYQVGKRREKTYAEMTDRLVSAVRSGLRVCAAFYGHPGVLVNASHAAIRRLRRQGYPARMLPGVSTEACLIADLGLNPGDRGWQSFEATDFLLSRRKIDPTTDLLLWQIGVIGEFSMRKDPPGLQRRLGTLVASLRRHYPGDHRVVLYEAATFPGAQSAARRVALDKLPRAKVFPVTTLYVPPIPQRSVDPKIARWYFRD